MNQKLSRKITPILDCAREHGWHAITGPLDAEGCTDAVMIGAESDFGHFSFSAAFGVNADTGRVAALRFDGKADAVIVVMHNKTGRYWYGPLNRYKAALADPIGWTGTEGEFAAV